MNTTNPLENLEVNYQQKSAILGEFQIKADGSLLDTRMQSAFLDLQKRVTEKGFRPGKVPLSLIKQKYHDNVFYDTYNRIAYDCFVVAAQQEKVRVAGDPQITAANAKDWKTGDKIEFTAKVELIPEVSLKKYKGLTIEQPEKSIGSEDIEKTLNQLREQRAELVNIEDRAIKEGDFAVIDFVGTLDGVVQDDAKATNFLIEIVDGKSMPEFKAGLLGEKIGAEKAIDVTYPEDYSNTNIAGKTINYQVKVHEIKEKKLPELNDELAKDYQEETLAALKAKIQKNLEEETEREQKNDLRNSAIEKLVEANDFEIPDTLKERQLQVIYRDVSRMLESQRFSKDLANEYLRRHSKELEDRAAKEVKLAFLLNKILEEESIEANDDDVKKYKDDLVQSMQSTEKEIEDFYAKNPDKIDELKHQIAREKTLDFIIENAKIKKVKA